LYKKEKLIIDENHKHQKTDSLVCVSASRFGDGRGGTGGGIRTGVALV
jgi:hypothetical protein